jgi:hypothetical protein
MGATVAIAKIELAHIRPSTAVPPLGMCQETAPIKPDNLIQRAPSRRVPCANVGGWPFSPATNSDPMDVQL